MNSILYGFLLSSLAGLSTLLGSLVILFKISKDKYNKFICFCLSFSLSIMIWISVFDLIPTYFLGSIIKKGLNKTILIIGSSFIFGFLTISFIDKLFHYIIKHNDLYKLGILNIVVLILHNLPEGIATFISSYNNFSLGIKFSIAIALHNIPEGIIISVPIYYSTGSKLRAFKATLLSGLSEPFGALLAFIIFRNHITPSLVNFILLLVAGLMITLSIQIILPKAIKYKEYKSLILGLIIGFLIVIFNLFLL